MKNINLIIFFIIIVGSLIRLYRFPQRMVFAPEQGLALSVSSEYINDKFSFLGQRTFLRTTNSGHIIYSGALYNYSLVPLIIVFKYNPIPITYFFALVNIAIGIVFFVLVKRQFNIRIAVFCLFIFSFSAEMINHSMFIWILHYLPLVSVLSIYFLIEFWRTERVPQLIFLGILSGIGVNLEYFYLFTLFALFLLVVFKAKRKVLGVLFFLAGAARGDFTMIFFDLRHHFYYLWSLLQYVPETFRNPSQSQINSYHFFHFWPVLFLVGAIIIERVYQKNTFMAVFILATFLILNLTSSQVSFSGPIGMPKGLVIADLINAATVIGDDHPGNFNLTSLPDNDFKAYALRYLVTYLKKEKPQNIENYQRIDSLYVFSEKEPELSIGPWELTAFGGRNISKLSIIGKGYAMYRVTKN